MLKFSFGAVVLIGGVFFFLTTSTQQVPLVLAVILAIAGAGLTVLGVWLMSQAKKDVRER